METCNISENECEMYLIYVSNLLEINTLTVNERGCLLRLHRKLTSKFE